jgi:ATP-dependent DNA helicase RecG
MLELATSVMYVKGVGPRIAEMLAEKGVNTVEDLLYYLPFRYEDRINPRPIAALAPGEMASLVAEVRTSGLFNTSRSHTPIFQLNVADPGGRVPLRCLFFHGDYLKDRFAPGQLLALYGKVEQDNFGRGGLQMMNPQFEVVGDGPEGGAAESLEVGRIVPVYESAGKGKLTSRWFRRVIHRALAELAPEIGDPIPAGIRRRLGLMARREAFCQAHWPDAGERFQDLESARTPAHQRLIFEELFFLEMGLELKRRRFKAQPGIVFAVNDAVRAALKRILPFHPTAAQKRVLREIAEDMQRPSPQRRLIQGDVGSGKTIVAFQAAVIALENGYQVALMAPTEILAQQHYLSARRLLAETPYRIVLLTGSLEDEHKRAIRRRVASGDAQLVIGTHALIQQSVEFARLGLVIVDEQHRFGVMQRFKLMKKPLAAGEAHSGARQMALDGAAAAAPAAGAAVPEPDTIVMTATPIPRTLALTLYGDLDASVIDELPPGRTPIVTRRVGEDRIAEVWEFARKQVKAGHQVYVVYPVIEEQGEDAEEPDEEKAPARPARAAAKRARKPQQQSLWSGLKAAVQMYQELQREIFPDLRVGLLHGRLTPEEKETVMNRFSRGEIDVLVSTTVIEVGVDVPNANLMVIEHADRFGLSQLHQLRGRIGRGAAKSYCLLSTSGRVSEEADRRLAAMVRTSNGFEIAELDLELRGPGEFFGTRQAGMPDFRVSNIVRDREILQLAKEEAARLAAGPSPELTAEEIAAALAYLRTHWQRKYGLVEVG